MNGGAEPHRALRPRRWIVPAWLCIGIGLAYANCLRGPFVFDDIWTIPEQLYIRRPDLVGALFRLSPPRFLYMLTLAVNYWIGGLRVIDYHVFNVLLHMANTLLVYRLYTHWFPQPPRAGRRGTTVALIATLGFALTPMQTQAVAYITGRSTLMGTLFLLLTVVTYVQSRHAASPPRRYGWLALSFLAYGMGNFTKEIAAVAPALLIVWEFWGRPGEWPGRRWLGAARTWPYFAILAGALYFREFVVRPEWGFFLPRSVGLNLMSEAFISWRYAVMEFIPVGLTIDHELYEATGWGDPRVWLGLALWVGAGAVAWRMRRTAPQISVGLAWFFLGLLPDSSIVPLEDIMADHRAYLPSIGLWAVAGALWTGWYKALLARTDPRRARRRVAPLTVAVLALLACGTVARNRVWSDPIRLWQDAIRKSPGRARPLANLARYYAEAGDYDRAFALANRAIALDPSVPAGFLNRGVIHLEQGRLHEAEADISSFIALHRPRRLIWAVGRSKLATAHHDLGVVYTRMGRHTDAVQAYRRALRLNPLSRQVMLNYGLTLERLGEFTQARDLYGRLVGMDDSEPQDWAHFQRAQQLHEAEVTMLRAVRDAPGDAFPLLQLGVFYDDLGLTASAENMYRTAAGVAPNEPLVPLLLANLLRRTGRPADARTAYRRVLELEPDSAEALSWLGQMLLAQGLSAEARPLLERAREIEPTAGTPGWLPPRILLDGRVVKDS